MNQSQKNFCRCCGSTLPLLPLLALNCMPKSAQNFPTEETLLNDSGVDLELFQCEYCGIIQLTGEPVSYYRDVIRAVGVSAAMKKFRLNQFKSWVKENSLTGRKILEIGCDTGDYLAIMDQTDAIAYGLENNSDSVKAANLKRCKVFKGFIDDENVKLNQAPFDAFYCLNFLEHIPNPRNFLRGILKNLSDDAVGLLEVPNMDMILQENLYSELIQDHLLYFTRDTLTRFLECNGFEVLQCRTILNDYVLSAEIKRRRQMNLDGFTKAQNLLQTSVEKFFEQMKRRGLKVAIWGAGHQALANISLLKMKDHVECVLDSAAFKQNKYTPATHIPILSPDVLEKKEIGAVLVMGGSYSKEIREILRQKYSWVVCAMMTPTGIEYQIDEEELTQ